MDQTIEASLPINTACGQESAPIDQAFKIVEDGTPPMARTRGRLTVCAATDLPPGQKRIVADGAASIGVFNIAGRFHALKNVCPHQGAPLCAGTIHGTHAPASVHEYAPCLQGRIIRCPWHGWEFDIVTGKGLYDASGRVATYACEVDEAGNVVVLV